MQWLDTPYQFSIGTSGSWVDVDLSSVLPEGAIGIVLRAYNNNLTQSAYAGARAKGVTSQPVFPIYSRLYRWLYCGLDNSRVLQAYQYAGTITFRVEAYFEYFDGFFFTSGSLPYLNIQTPSWYTWSLADHIPEDATIQAGVFILAEAISGAGAAVRPVGSTDSYYSAHMNWGTGRICKLNEDRAVEVLLDPSWTTTSEIWCVGYLRTMGEFVVNPSSIPSTEDTWMEYDMSAVRPAPRGAIVHARRTGIYSENAGVRPGGSSENPSTLIGGYFEVFCKVNPTTRKIEVFRDEPDSGFVLLGYAYDANVYIVQDVADLIIGEEGTANIAYDDHQEVGLAMADQSTFAGPWYVEDEIALILTEEGGHGKSFATIVRLYNKILVWALMELVHSYSVQRLFAITNRLAEARQNPVSIRNKLAETVSRSFELVLSLDSRQPIVCSLVIRNSLAGTPQRENI